MNLENLIQLYSLRLNCLSRQVELQHPLSHTLQGLRYGAGDETLFCSRRMR